jgi:CRISPR-associated protein Csx17
MPLWNRLAGKNEIETLFSEGRSSVGRRLSSRGVDFARATATLGVDRGINAFQRFGIVKGRVGGDNYNTSASLGHFAVHANPDVDLLRKADGWLDAFRTVVTGDNVPPRFRAALRRIESAIIDFCRFGGAARFASILCAFGNAERELANGEKFRNDKNIRPLSGLSSEWLRAANDNSYEFDLALSLAGIYDPENKVEPVRSNLEPVLFGKWKEKDFCNVWNNAGLSLNLLSVLERRLMDAERIGCKNLPIMSPYKASLDAISNYIAGNVDDGRIEELLWGMMLIDHRQPLKTEATPYNMGINHGVKNCQDILPRPYALLKLVFLPALIKSVNADVYVRPEPAIMSLLRAGRTGEACVIASRRLKASGLTPMTYRRNHQQLHVDDWQAAGIDPERLGAALLFPVSIQDTDRLTQMVINLKNNQDAA